MLEALAFAALLATAEQNINGGRGCGYPCNHYVHVVEGAALAAAVTHYYGESTAWKIGLGFAVGTEVAGKLLHNKKISAADIATRSLGTGAGIWFYKQF
jgi:hypothetical protein